MCKVVLIFRKPYSSSISIEYLFKAISTDLQKKIEVKEYTVPFFSTGLLNRLINTLSLLRFKGRTVHVTGDIYYTILGALSSNRIITIHDLSFLYRTSGLARSILKLFWVTLPVKFSHKVVAISNATKQEILKEVNIPTQKIIVIPDFIDPIYKPVKRSFNTNNPRILQVGVSFNKNIERLIAALVDIKCTLVIIGKLTEAQSQLLLEKDINFENYSNLSIEMLYNEYSKADMLSFVSTVEGFGMPILEAQASALPVVTSNCSSMGEVAGNGAVLVDPFTVNSIRDGILQVINDDLLRESIIKAGLENVKVYSREQVVEEYIKLYQSFN